MSSIEQARIEILKAIIIGYLSSAVARNKSLAQMREGLKVATVEYKREFIIWGPEIEDSQTLIVTVLGWEAPVTLYAPAWCVAHQDTEKPVAP